MTSYFYLKFNLALTVYWAIILLNTANGSEIAPRIVGGTAILRNTSNFIVSISRNGTFICGGALVTRLHVVTAAHCVNGVLPRFLLVRGGSSFSNQSGLLRAVTKNIVSGGYNATTNNLDIAVLKLRLPMNASNISPIPLSLGALNVGDTVRTYGWGRTNASNTVFPTQLRTAVFSVISIAQCQSRFGSNTSITRNMMCANSTSTKDVCTGDAGGPVVKYGRLYGVVSRDSGCGTGTVKVAVFNRVIARAVRRFINRAIAL